ncbi:MAG: hypothetical protein MJ223_04305 [Mycoplasmoidaceae bacterium]|nr:hypothetical protein [Mycoplasmoidaceae bacterium]
MKLNKLMAYAAAFILAKKHNAIIADIGELENDFYVDFESKKPISISDFKKLENEVIEFIYNRKNVVEFKKANIAKVKQCNCLKKNKYLAH